MEENKYGNSNYYQQIENETLFSNNIVQEVPFDEGEGALTGYLVQDVQFAEVDVYGQNITDENIDSQSLQSSTIPISLPAQPQQAVERLPISLLSQDVINNLTGPHDLENTPATRNVPDSTNWRGSYDFDIAVQTSENISNGPSVLYSSAQDTLYIMKDSCCRINFITCNRPDDVKLRAMAVFSEPKYARKIVKRCFNHTMRDYQNGVNAPDHLIRCECDNVIYEKDPVSGRRSVVIPYESPHMGQNYSTYIFKFACRGSCEGGLNRRPFRVIFTLEQGSTVIGRRSVNVKITSDPLKDFPHEKACQVLSSETTVSKSLCLTGRKRKLSDQNSHVIEILNFLNKMGYSGAAKKNSTEASGGPYTITVQDRETFEVLMFARMLFLLRKALDECSPYLIQYLMNSQMQKSKPKKRKKDDESN